MAVDSSGEHDGEAAPRDLPQPVETARWEVPEPVIAEYGDGTRLVTVTDQSSAVPGFQHSVMVEIDGAAVMSDKTQRLINNNDVHDDPRGIAERAQALLSEAFPGSAPEIPESLGQLRAAIEEAGRVRAEAEEAAGGFGTGEPHAATQAAAIAMLPPADRHRVLGAILTHAHLRLAGAVHPDTGVAQRVTPIARSLRDVYGCRLAVLFDRAGLLKPADVKAHMAAAEQPLDPGT